MAKPVRVFLSYAHLDEHHCNDLRRHLAVLQHEGLIEIWHDRAMSVGSDVDTVIAERLKAADIVVAIVSSSFLNSYYCYKIELEKAIARRNAGEAYVVPVIMEPCLWRRTILGGLLAAPTDGKAVTTWANREEALNTIAEQIAKFVDSLQSRSAAATPTVPSGQAGSGKSSGTAAVDAIRAAPPPPPNKVIDGVVILRDPAEWLELPDLTVFKHRDEVWCPEMVVLPKGSFVMGSPPGEAERSDDEGPQHRVEIGYRLAIGRYAVTHEEYDHFCAATKRKKPYEEGWGRGRRPVIYVSWNDAQAHCAWLSEQTGQHYCLPSEAEWEYACRAGTTTPFSFGRTITSGQVNFPARHSVPVGSLPANPWGLHEMHGNVWEWVEDHWHESYEGAPLDGSAWIDRSAVANVRRVERGGAWIDHAGRARSAARYEDDPGHSHIGLGFRCALRSSEPGQD